MKKGFALCLIAIMFAVIMTSCSGWRSRYLGGTMNVTVPAGEVFVNSTWKDSNLWVICYNPTTKQYIMHETSNMGIFKGTVIISGGETPKDGVTILPQAPPPPPPAEPAKKK